MEEQGLQRAGAVNIEQLKLITSANEIVDLTEFLVELSIYEDIFSSHLYGSILLTDSRNILDIFNIHGEEFLNVRIKTPSFPDDAVIEKTFRVYKISDRNIVRDNNTQNFVLHFISIEMFYDMLMPLFVSFEGNITDVIGNIFSTFIASSRNFEIAADGTSIKENETPTHLIVLNEAKNQVKFVSPGWSPMKCIRWLASKSIPKETTASNFLFFESNKNFYFGSVEAIFKSANENKNFLGTYFVSASNIREQESSQNVSRELFLAKDVEMIETADYIKNYTSGYLANRLVYLDVFNKEYQLVDYDYITNYSKQFHTSGEGEKAIPLFAPNTVRNFATNIKFYPKNPKLFDNFKDNINEKMDVIHGNRLSSLLELTNIKLNITIPGRTDAEIGRMLYFNYPALGPSSEEDTNTSKQDKQYSGFYLITAINHKITKNEHMMTCELVKDSLLVDNESYKRLD